VADQDQAQERTLEPSAKRLEDARREGQVPRSRDLAHLLVLGSAAGLLFLLAAPLMEAGQRLIALGLRFDAAVVADPSQLSGRLAALAASALMAVAPLLLALMVAAIAAPLVLGGFVYAPTMAAPKLERIDPFKGIARLFSAPALVELVKVILVSVLLGAVGAWYVASHLHEFASLAHESLPRGLAHFGWMLALAFAALVATLAVTSAIDVPFQIFHHRSKLKMTVEEVRKELKETEGDPYLKARIRQQQREMARRRMMAAVPEADVVVTNPTHVAVALKYREGRQRAPVVVAKGADALAAKIREVARGAGVPLDAAVAQVLAYVYQLRSFGAGRGPRPVEPREIELPEGMDPVAPSATAGRT
jgi:flagellar biosynthetic protein FlhB